MSLPVCGVTICHSEYRAHTFAAATAAASRDCLARRMRSRPHVSVGKCHRRRLSEPFPGLGM